MFVKSLFFHQILLSHVSDKKKKYIVTSSPCCHFSIFTPLFCWFLISDTKCFLLNSEWRPPVRWVCWWCTESIWCCNATFCHYIPKASLPGGQCVRWNWSKVGISNVKSGRMSCLWKGSVSGFLFFLFYAVFILRRNCTSNQNFACFMHYLKIINTSCLAWTEFSKRLCDHSFCT